MTFTLLGIPTEDNSSTQVFIVSLTPSMSEEKSA